MSSLQGKFHKTLCSEAFHLKIIIPGKRSFLLLPLLKGRVRGKNDKICICDIVMQAPPLWASIVTSQQVHKRWNLHHSGNNKCFLILMKPLASADRDFMRFWCRAQHFPIDQFEKTCLKPGLSYETNNLSCGLFNPCSLKIYFQS